MKNNLIVLLAERRMSIKELSEKTGISKNTLYAIKTEKQKGIKFETIDRICKALDCDVNDFIVKEA